MPHWRQKAKENARLVMHTKELLEALEGLVAAFPGPVADSRYKIAVATIAKVKANSTETVE